LEVQQQAVVAMAEWDRNPPEEDKELFAEIDQASSFLAEGDPATHDQGAWPLHTDCGSQIA
jgi:hypothetical protein